MKGVVISSLLLSGVSAFPFVLDAPGVDSGLLAGYRAANAKRQQPGKGPGSEKNCPYNPNHVPAPLVTKKYPYNNARHGQQGDQRGGFLVPAKGDTAHRFIAPNPKTDIRGPCPGLNAMANHNFLARDGVTTFNELVDAQQNVYNVGHDLAQTLAVLGVTLTDGDIVTEKVSIGCDATNRTSYNPTLTGHEPGLDGHNKFEGDTSLSRNDFFLGKGDDFKFNGTLFGMMSKTTKNNFDLKGLALYRKQRYDQSRKNNPHFFFGPLSLLLFGAASFLYELFPSETRGFAPDLYTIGSFFGATQQKDGTFVFNNHESMPDNWKPRLTPYKNMDVTNQIVQMYLLHPVLFGGNTADGSFDAISFGTLITNGTLNPAITPSNSECLLYQLATGSIPSSLNSVITPSVETLAFIESKIGPQFKNLGCPGPLTK